MSSKNDFLEEENEDLFETKGLLGNVDFEEEEEENDFIQIDSDFLNEEEEEEEEIEEEEGEEEEEEEEENENSFSEKELEILNKKLGTDYKNVEELKKNFKKTEEESLIEKENQDYKAFETKVNLYDNYINMKDESLIRAQLFSEAKQKDLDIEDQDVIDEIEEKLQGLIDMDQLKTMAETLRTNLTFQKEKAQNEIDKINQNRSQRDLSVAQKNTEKLQNALSEIFAEKTFFGISVSEKDIKEVYKDIRENKFVETVNGNQEIIAKLAMFLKYEKEISKLLNKPTHSDKTRTAFDFLSQNDKKDRRSITQAKGSALLGDSADNLKGFLK